MSNQQYTTRVIGDRQVGKTEMMLAFAEKLCREGQKVLYVADGRPVTRNNFTRAAQSVQGVSGFRSYRSNGSERITHDSGGELRFTYAAADPRGWVADTVFLDDVHDYYYPVATHVVRASL